MNEAIEKDRIQEVILVSEALHDQKFVQVAKEIAEGEKKVRVVLSAGPSSSGKTTFSKRLSIELSSFSASGSRASAERRRPSNSGREGRSS